MKNTLVLVHANFPDAESAETTRSLLTGALGSKPSRPVRFIPIALLALVSGVVGAALTATMAVALATGIPTRPLVMDAGTIGGLIGLFVGGWAARGPRRQAEPGALMMTSTTDRLHEALEVIRFNGGSAIEVLKLDP